MDHEGAVKEHGARQALPDERRIEATLLHRLPTENTQRMVEKVQRHIGEDNESAGEPEPACSRSDDGCGAGRPKRARYPKRQATRHFTPRLFWKNVSLQAGDDNPQRNLKRLMLAAPQRERKLFARQTNTHKCA